MKIRQFLEDKSGSTPIVVAFGTVMILASAALAVDMGYAYVIETRLQGTADFAAMAGAAELPAEDYARSSAHAYADLNMAPASHGDVLSDGDVTIGHWDAGTRIFTANATPANAVQVVTRRSDTNGNPLGLFFGRALGVVDVNVTRTAIAARSSSHCILALKPDETGISVNADGDITTQDCGIHANSTDDNSIVTNSGSNITVDGGDICTAGDYEGGGYSPDPYTDCGTKPDPLAGVVAPPIGSCDHSDKVVIEDGDVTTLSPGRYCKGIEINAATIALNR